MSSASDVTTLRAHRVDDGAMCFATAGREKSSDSDDATCVGLVDAETLPH
jgi:hypothetical protein